MTYYWDTRVPGFALRVGPDKKSWVLRYAITRVKDNMRKTTQRMVTFAEFPEFSLVNAREQARAYRSDIRLKKIYPHENLLLNRRKVEQELNALKGKAPFTDICELWYSNYALKHYKDPGQARAMLDRDIIPSLGLIPLDAINKENISTALEKIVNRGSSVMANRTAQLIRSILQYAYEKGKIETNPFPSVRKKSIGGAEKVRDRVLSVDEIKSFWNGLDQIGIAEQTTLALRILLLTGQRRSELCEAKKTHFKDNIWTIPEELSKNGKPHVVHLSSQTKKLVKAANRLAGKSSYLFPNSRNNKQPMNGDTLTRAIARNWESLADEKFTVHDLRRTVATHLASLGYQIHIIEKILNHSMRGVMAVYNKEAYLPERKQALNAWSEYVQELISDA